MHFLIKKEQNQKSKKYSGLSTTELGSHFFIQIEIQVLYIIHLFRIINAMFYFQK